MLIRGSQFFVSSLPEVLTFLVALYAEGCFERCSFSESPEALRQGLQCLFPNAHLAAHWCYDIKQFSLASVKDGIL